MKRIILPAILVSSWQVTHAQFEGVLTYESVHVSKVVTTIYESKTKARIEAKIYPLKGGVPDVSGEKDQDVILFDFQKKKETHLHDKVKMAITTDYTEIIMEQAMKLTDADVTVEKLGAEKAGEFSCQHFLVKIKGGKKDLWITKDLGTSGILMGSEFLYYPPECLVYKKIINAGGDGVVIKAQVGPIITNLTAYQKKSLPSSVFQPPANYTMTERTMPVNPAAN